QDRVLHQCGSDRRVIGTAQSIENGSLMEPFFYLWAKEGDTQALLSAICYLLSAICYLLSAICSVACSHTTAIRHLSRLNTGYKKTGT
ncbi:hypothetical protein, partial [Aeromonas veronii]|uniref:hypothetical protein n=1 Tax=Aeromonas veronii TaxID=654 RepID=UPI003D220ACA